MIRSKDTLSIVNDTLSNIGLVKQPKKFRVETPIGAVYSDSGNHLVDVGTVLIVILAFFLMRKFFKAT